MELSRASVRLPCPEASTTRSAGNVSLLPVQFSHRTAVTAALRGVVMNLCALQLSRTSILRYSTKAFTHSEFKQWPRQAVDRDAEIPPRKGVISRELSEIVVTHAKPHGSGPRKALYKTGE
jgi:hypothetical protein